MKYFIFLILLLALNPSAKGDSITQYRYRISTNLISAVYRTPKMQFEFRIRSNSKWSLTSEIGYRIRDKENGRFLASNLSSDSSRFTYNKSVAKEYFPVHMYSGPIYSIGLNYVVSKKMYLALNLLYRYNWYKNGIVHFTDDGSDSPHNPDHYRIQDEVMYSFGPGFEYGIFNIKKRKYINFISGVNLNYTVRKKFIYYEYYRDRNSAPVSNIQINSNFNSNSIIPTIYFGLNIGLLRK